MNSSYLLALMGVAGVGAVVYQRIAGNPRVGFLVTFLLGILGAAGGQWLVGELRFPPWLPITLGETTFSLAWAFVGAALLQGTVALVWPLRRRP